MYRYLKKNPFLKIFKKHGKLALLFPILAVSVFLLCCDYWITHIACSYIFDSLEEVPYHEIGLVPGCSQYLADGRRNLFFRYRVEAAAGMYHEGKVKTLILSGDSNLQQNYNEPADMKNALIKLGVPEKAILCDFVGFSTFDSIVNAKKNFGFSKFVIISQKFHNERAIAIAMYKGLEIIGYNAQDVDWADGGWKTKIREYLARVKTILDIFFFKR